MKKVLFPATNRVHLARQKLLFNELKKHFDLQIVEHEPVGNNMAEKALHTHGFFLRQLTQSDPDLVIIRADRFEMLPIAMVASYMNIPIVHIEGGDLSSVIDGKVRHAIAHLSDYHFPTNEDARQRLIRMGIPEDRIWNFGSLDVELATKVEPKRLKENSYILVAYHPIPDEDPEEIENALKQLSDYKVVRVASNSDYGRSYGAENYSPEDYINLVRYASCCVGNSSSFFKEASVFGTPVVNVGTRQAGRLRTGNIVDAPCEWAPIARAIQYQVGNLHEPDATYYRTDTAKHIARKLKEILYV